MIIGMSCTENWHKYLMVDLYALLSTNKVKKIYLFLETDTLENVDKLREYFDVEIEIINYNNFFSEYIQLKENYEVYFTKAALIRLFFSKIIKEDKILYLDTDAIVLQDISELWNTDITNYYVAGVIDKGLYNCLDYLDLNGIPDDSINSGVMLMNLAKIRKGKIDDLFIKEINKKKYRYPDQDVINKVCKDKILFISNEYNSSRCTGIADNIKIMHYVYVKDERWLERHFKKELWYDWETKYNEFLFNYKEN